MTPTEHSRARAGEAASGDLVEIARQIGELLAKEAAGALQHHRAIGKLVLDVRKDARYGDAGVQKLARIVGVGAKMLYRLAARADAFSDEVFAAAQHEASERRYALTGSILDELVAVADETKRCQWLACAMREKWTVQRTRRELRGASAPESPSPKKTGLPKVTARAEAFLQALTDAEASEDFADEDRARVLESLAEVATAISRAIERLSAGGERPRLEPTP